jgi:hypothetical protein
MGAAHVPPRFFRSYVCCPPLLRAARASPAADADYASLSVGVSYQTLIRFLIRFLISRMDL